MKPEPPGFVITGLVVYEGKDKDNVLAKLHERVKDWDEG